MVKHVFWDMGGTLVDTYPALNEAFAEVVRRHGHRVSIDEVAGLTRQSTAVAVQGLSTRFGIDATEFDQANAALKLRWTTRPAPLMPGVIELMRDISDAGGLNLVVTHRERSSAQSLVDGLGLAIDDLVSTSDGYPRKPDPAMYLALVDEHELDVNQCLAVGDRPIDTQAAQAAGIIAAHLGEADDDPAAQVQATTLDDLRPALGLG